MTFEVTFQLVRGFLVVGAEFGDMPDLTIALMACDGMLTRRCL